jgi:hypothetical protein
MELGQHRVVWKSFPIRSTSFVTFARESLPHEQPTNSQNTSWNTLEISSGAMISISEIPETFCCSGFYVQTAQHLFDLTYQIRQISFDPSQTISISKKRPLSLQTIPICKVITRNQDVLLVRPGAMAAAAHPIWSGWSAVKCHWNNSKPLTVAGEFSEYLPSKQF